MNNINFEKEKLLLIREDMTNEYVSRCQKFERL